MLRALTVFLSLALVGCDVDLFGMDAKHIAGPYNLTLTDGPDHCAIQLKHDYAEAHANLGAALAQLEKSSEAAEVLNKAVQLNAHEGEVVITGTMNNPGSVIAVIADLSEILVEATVGETEITGIRVNQGDRLTFQSSGEIQLRPAGNNDAARVAGSLTGRRAPQSPLPNALAGALIGRIDSGQPFGIGDQTSIVAPASGLLYLGVNDDLLTDNSGQFTVTISW